MTHKKVYLLWIICLWFFSWICINYWYGQQTGDTYKESDMNNVNISFCDDGTGNLKPEETVYLEANKEKKICLYVSNEWNKKMEFVYGFAMGWFSKSWDPTCDANMNTGNYFSQLIPQTHERNIVIDPMSYQTLEETIIIPPGMSGMQLGCLVYKLHNPEYKNVGGMFVLEVHRATHFNIVVWWESDVKSNIQLLDSVWGVFSTNKKVKAEVDADNNLTVKFNVKNWWNISQNVTITGKIYNVLWFQNDFSISSKEIAPGATNEFVGNVGMLPLYKWPFTIKFTVKNEPQFMFPISNEKLKEPWYITEKTSIFIFSRILVIVALIVVFILYRALFHRKAKQVIVQS